MQVEIDRLYLLAVPNYMQDAPPPQSTEEEEERLAARKREELDAEERHWVEGMQAAEHAQAVAANPGYIQGIVNVVLGNLKLKVSANLPPILFSARLAISRFEELKAIVFVLRRSPTCIYAMKMALHSGAIPLRWGSHCIASGRSLWMRTTLRCL